MWMRKRRVTVCLTDEESAALERYRRTKNPVPSPSAAFREMLDLRDTMMLMAPKPEEPEEPPKPTPRPDWKRPPKVGPAPSAAPKWANRAGGEDDRDDD
jgi:hypothetical protein